MLKVVMGHAMLHITVPSHMSKEGAVKNIGTPVNMRIAMTP